MLVDREDANYKAYGTMGKNAKQILSGSVDCPPWASSLVNTLDRFTLINTPSKDLDGEYFNYDDTSSFDSRGLAGSGGGNRFGSDESIDSRDLAYKPRRDPPRRAYSSSQSQQRTSSFSSDDGVSSSRFDQIAIHDRTDSRSADDWEVNGSRTAGTYAFGTSSTLSNTPTSSEKQKRPSVRHRSSSIASNLSFSNLGRKKLDRSGPTPPPDWNEIPGQSKSTETWGNSSSSNSRREHPPSDGMDSLDRELQISSSSHSANGAARQSGMPRYGSYKAGATTQPSTSDAADRHRRGSSLSNSNSNSGRGTPANWSQFPSSHDDDPDDLFGGSHNTASDPFADLASESKRSVSGSSASFPKKNAVPPTKSPTSFFGRTASYRTPSPGSSAFGRRKTPTITEDDYGGHTSLIPHHRDDHHNTDDDDDNDTHQELLDRLRQQQVRGGSSSSSSHESFSLSSSNASVPVVERVIALFDFEAQEEGDLGFQKGQVIGVIKKTASRDDWWQGRVEAGMSASNIGIFPANYTQSL